MDNAMKAPNGKKSITTSRDLPVKNAAAVKGGTGKRWSTSGDADDRPIEEVAFYYPKG